MTNVFFNNGKAALLKNDMDSVTLRLAYMATSYTPDIDNDVYFSDISAEVASGSPTETLASITITVDNTNNRVEVDAADVSEASVTTITDKFVIYIWTGVAATSELICCIDIVEGTLQPVAGPLSIAFNAEGIFAV
jgi:hypothetical protein